MLRGRRDRLQHDGSCGNAVYDVTPAALFDLLYAKSAELMMPTSGHDLECIHNGVGVI